ncbi:Uncharacterised protein [Escherichia coli]|uniref:Uncharacterized protein n=1 Tax=Escherichia coli TaxID=562 RepID=A0A376SCP2_ECOLX|nr:Uncharacterised protein [Escherichia coli]
MSEEITEYTYYEKYMMGKVNFCEIFLFFVVAFLSFRFTSLVSIFYITKCLWLNGNILFRYLFYFCGCNAGSISIYHH